MLVQFDTACVSNAVRTTGCKDLRAAGCISAMDGQGKLHEMWLDRSEEASEEAALPPCGPGSRNALGCLSLWTSAPRATIDNATLLPTWMGFEEH